MKICVINGSPKGEYSITLQTVRYLQKHFPQDQFEVLQVGQRLRQCEKDIQPAAEAISSAELILFSYPVYTFIAPYQLHRFIELLKRSGTDISGRYASQITTSKHFFDFTAHRYVEQNCEDMGLKVIRGFSADMDDLLTEKGQQQALEFWKYLRFCVENGLHEPAPEKSAKAVPAYRASLPAVQKQTGRDTVIVTNCEPEDESLAAMIADFEAVYPYPTRVVNIAEYPFAGGCLGCFHCAADGTCVYRDGFDRFLREQIQTADAIVYAFTVKDHSMGASFKRYDDRQFCNGHRTVTMGMPMGYLIRGDYAAEPNLAAIIEGRCEVGGNFLCGTACDAEQIRALSARLCYALDNAYTRPQNFYGVGGMKIFRDLIYLMRGLMKADHRFYRKHGIYDFPQKKQGTILKMKLVGSLMTNPRIRAKMGNRMNEGMIAPYKKVIDK